MGSSSLQAAVVGKSSWTWESRGAVGVLYGGVLESSATRGISLGDDAPAADRESQEAHPQLSSTRSRSMIGWLGGQHPTSPPNSFFDPCRLRRISPIRASCPPPRLTATLRPHLSWRPQVPVPRAVPAPPPPSFFFFVRSSPKIGSKNEHLCSPTQPQPRSTACEHKHSPSSTTEDQLRAHCSHVRPHHSSVVCKA